MRVPIHRRNEEDCALDWLVTAVGYSPSGRVSAPDVSIRSNSPCSERDVQKILKPPQIAPERSARINAAGLRVKEGDANFVPRTEDLSRHLSVQAIEEGGRRREGLVINGMIPESYRFLDPAMALKWL